MQPDPEFLTVKELAALLRLKERKIYDLASSGAVPCSRATGKLLFPSAEIRAWIARESAGGTQGTDKVRPPILLGSHDPLLDWAIRESRSGLATFFDGSGDGLERFLDGGGVAAGLHLFDPARAAWNIPAVQRAATGRNVALIGFAKRVRGLVLGGHSANVDVMADLKGQRIVPRQPGSGAQSLFDHLAAREGLTPEDFQMTAMARTETEAVQAVARGDADVALGLETMARDFSLSFVPLMEERYDLLIDRRSWFEPQMQHMFAFLRSAAFQSKARGMGGYDVSELGAVRWNG